MSHSLRSTPEALQKFCKFLEKHNRKFIPQLKGGLTRDDVKRFLSHYRDRYNEYHATETTWGYYGDDYGPSRHTIYSKFIYADDLDTLADNYMQSVKNV